MKLRIILFLSIAISANLAHSEDASHKHIVITEVAYLTSFDQKDNTYGGYVHVEASPCPNANYSLNLMVAKAKNSDDAKLLVQDQFNKISSDINRAANDCESRK